MIVVHAQHMHIRKVDSSHCNDYYGIDCGTSGGEIFIGMHVLFVFRPPVPGEDASNGSGHLQLPALEGPFPSHKLQQSMTVPYVGDDLVESELPACQSFYGRLRRVYVSYGFRMWDTSADSQIVYLVHDPCGFSHSSPFLW